MQNRMGWNPYVKGLAFWAVFMVMYFAYKVFPGFPLSLLCAANESNFQHYKAGFVAYLVASAIEYMLVRQRVQNKSSYLFSRLGAATCLPWFIFVLWYIAPATVGRWGSNALEVIYANIIILLVGFGVATFEQGLEQIRYFRQLRFVLIALFLASILLYLVFTFNLPWADVFAEPQW